MKQNTVNIESVCVDNKDIRQRIINDKKIKINVVPTIVITYSTGILEKYEGERALDLLYEMIEIKNPVQEIEIKNPVQEIEIKNPVQEIEIKNSVQEIEIKNPVQEIEIKKNNGITSLDELSDEDILKNEKSDTGRGNTDNNLPIKQTSKVTSKAAEIAKNRELMDSFIKKPTQNNLHPKI